MSDHDVAVYAIRSPTAKSPWKVIMLINLTLKQLDELGPTPRLEVFSALQGFCDAAWADSSVDEDNKYCLSSIVTNEGAGTGIFLWGLYDVQERDAQSCYVLNLEWKLMTLDFEGETVLNKLLEVGLRVTRSGNSCFNTMVIRLRVFGTHPHSNPNQYQSTGGS